LANKITEVQKEVVAFRKSHGATKVGEITVDMVSGGKGLYYIYNLWVSAEWGRAHVVLTKCDK
jgi:hypothetical protein